MMAAPHRAMARRLARSRFGRSALSQTETLPLLKRKPTPRVFAGLVLLGCSLIFGLPVLALLGYLSVRMGRPAIIAVGGPVVIVLVHVSFGVGLYLTGRPYARQVLLRLTKRFLEKYA